VLSDEKIKMSKVYRQSTTDEEHLAK
jgi:hypothetical protein